MLRKYATTEILGAEMAPQDAAGLRRMAHRHSFEYTPRPGYLYVRSRAISSRTNDNFDTFPAEEIKKAYATFVGKPVFVNHNNDNHRRARGVIIDAALHEDKNPDGSPDTWAEVLMEVDAVRFPKLAKAILAGHIDRTSMGTDVKFSVCSFCNNKASTPLEYCAHIPKLKGKRIYRTTASGQKEGVLVSEICHGLGFFENSLLVEEPADPTAFFLGVDDHSGMSATASKTADWTMKPCDCGGSKKIEPHTNGQHSEWATKAYAEGKTDAWGDPIKQPYDGHGAFNCNNYSCTEHPKEMYKDGPGMPGWLKHDTDPHKEVTREVGKHFHELGQSEDARFLLDQQHQGPSKYSSLQAEAGAGAHGKQPFVEGHWTTHDTVPGPDGKFRAHCECGQQFPARDNHIDAYGDKMAHAMWDNPDYDEDRIKQRMLEAQDEAPSIPVGTTPQHMQRDPMHPSQWSLAKRLPTTKPVSRPIRPKTAAEVYGHSIELGPDDHEFFQQAHEDGQRRREMADHGQQRPVDLSDHGDLLSHLHDHGYDESDMWRNSHHESHPALGPAGGDDRPLHPDEVRSLHDWEHGHGMSNDHPDYGGGLPGHFMGDSHFHTAGLRAEAKGPAFENPADHPSYAYLGIHPQHIIDHFHEASEDEVHQGMRWYADAHHVAKAIAGGDAHKGAGVLSAYSPQTNWPTNMLNAARTFIQKRAVRPGEGATVMHSHANAAQRILDGDHHQEVLGAPKTNDFAHLIEHAGKDPESGGHSQRVVMDRHAISVAAGRRLHTAEDESHVSKVLGTRHYYEHAAEAYRHAARHLSEHFGHEIAPHQVQAVTWLVRQRKNNDEINAMGGRPAGNLKGRQKAERNSRDKFNDHMREHHPDHVADGAPFNMHYNAALVYQAYGETMAPADVDTLRDEECPVCGEADAYDGNECAVCGFVAPPKMFQDPDLDLAKQMDLRKDNLDAEQADPNGDGMPDVIPGSGAPGPDMMPMDPSQVPDPQDVAQQQVNQITDEQQPLDPAALDINGQPINENDMAMQEPQEQDPNAEPMLPEDVAGQPEPGTPGDAYADLACANCGYQAPASPPQSTDMNQTAPDAGSAAGDICPNCGQDFLQSLKQMNADMTAQTGQPMPVKRF